MKRKFRNKKNENEKVTLLSSKSNIVNKRKSHKRQKYTKREYNKKEKSLFICLLLLIAIVIIFFISKKLIMKNIKNLLNLNESKLLKYNKIDYNINLTNINKIGELVWKNESMDISKIRDEITSYLHINMSFINNSYYYKAENPKVSLIITLYNQENFLPMIYTCILKQSLFEIEIIFIDDASTDNTTKTVNDYMIRDKRIIYLKNNINKGAFFSRNKAIYEAKGEYILILDPDDLLINDILIKAYKTAKQYDLDIVQFYMFVGKYNKPTLWKQLKYKGGILRQPNIKNIFYYCITRNLVDKFVRKEVFIKSIEFMDEKYKNDRFFIHDDDVAFFGLINVAQSYGFLEQAGYFYSFTNPKSRMNFIHSKDYIDKTFRSLFSIMKYYYEKSGNNEFEKNKIAFNFFENKVYKNFLNDADKVSEGFDFFNEVLDLYLNCPFYSSLQKAKLSKFKDKINDRKF